MHVGHRAVAPVAEVGVDEVLAVALRAARVAGVDAHAARRPGTATPRTATSRRAWPDRRGSRHERRRPAVAPGACRNQPWMRRPSDLVPALLRLDERDVRPRVAPSGASPARPERAAFRRRWCRHVEHDDVARAGRGLRGQPRCAALAGIATASGRESTWRSCVSRSTRVIRGRPATARSCPRSGASERDARARRRSSAGAQREAQQVASSTHRRRSRSARRSGSRPVVAPSGRGTARRRRATRAPLGIDGPSAAIRAVRAPGRVSKARSPRPPVMRSGRPPSASTR